MTTIHEIQAAVCRHYGVGLADLLSPRQEQRFVVPRHTAIWLCRRLTNHSLAIIGRRFGNRDHSSIYRSLRAVEARIAAVKAVELWALLAELQRPHVSAWPQMVLAHGWVTNTNNQAEGEAA